MPVQARFRSQLKLALRPVLGARVSGLLHGLARAWDIRSGAWTEPELELIPLAVRSGEWAIDVGANYGLYTYHLARAVEPGGQVIAFEPVPDTFATLKSSIRLFRLHNVKLVKKGLSNKSGSVVMELPVRDGGDIATRLAHIRNPESIHDREKPVTKPQKPQELICETVRLDDYLEYSGPVSFMKLDIEGAELWALEGAKETVERHKPTVVCEINPRFLAYFDIELSELLGFFDSRGYRRYVFDKPAQQLVSCGASQIKEGNYIFVHPLRMERLRDLLQ